MSAPGPATLDPVPPQREGRRWSFNIVAFLVLVLVLMLALPAGGIAIFLCAMVLPFLIQPPPSAPPWRSEPRRWSFSLWRLLAAFAVVGACLALAHPFGPAASACSLVTAFALAMMVLFFDRRDVQRLGQLLLGAFGGGAVFFFVSGCFLTPLFDHERKAEPLIAASTIIGALVGARYMTWPRSTKK